MANYFPTNYGYSSAAKSPKQPLSDLPRTDGFGHSYNTRFRQLQQQQQPIFDYKTPQVYTTTAQNFVPVQDNTWNSKQCTSGASSVVDSLTRDVAGLHLGRANPSTSSGPSTPTAPHRSAAASRRNESSSATQASSPNGASSSATQASSPNGASSSATQASSPNGASSSTTQASSPSGAHRTSIQAVTPNESYSSSTSTTAGASAAHHTSPQVNQAWAQQGSPFATRSKPFPDSPMPMFNRAVTQPAPLTPAILANFPYRETLSPMSPFNPVTGTVLPASYERHRQEMGQMKKLHADFQSSLVKFSLTEGMAFSEWLFNTLPNFRFQEVERVRVMAMSDKLNGINEAVEKSRKPIQNLMRCYQLYEKLVKTAYGSRSTLAKQEAQRRLVEVEMLLNQLEAEVKIELLYLNSSFRTFICDFTSFLTKKAIADETAAHRAFYDAYLRDKAQGAPKLPTTFAGMGYEYKQLLNQTREFRGSAWLNDLMRPYVEGLFLQDLKKPYQGELVALNISALSRWIIGVEQNWENYPEEVQNAVLGMKERVGCWEQYDSEAAQKGKSLEVYLRFHHHLEGNITYPFKEVEMTPEMEGYFKELNTFGGLTTWLQSVYIYFNQETGWSRRADIALKKKALIVYCFDINNQNEAVQAMAIKHAKQIVKHLYSVELTVNQQQ